MLVKEQEIGDYVHVYFSSSNILKITYNNTLKEMEVTFGKGGKYKYKKVPRYVFLQIKNASSQGKIFDSLIKKGERDKIYEMEKVGVVSDQEIQEIKKIIDGNIICE